MDGTGKKSNDGTHAKTYDKTREPIYTLISNTYPFHLFSFFLKNLLTYLPVTMHQIRTISRYNVLTHISQLRVRLSTLLLLTTHQTVHSCLKIKTKILDLLSRCFEHFFFLIVCLGLVLQEKLDNMCNVRIGKQES